MYGRSKHSPKKHHNSNKLKDGSGSSSSSTKQKDLKPAIEPPPSEDKEIPLPVLKMVDVEKHLQSYSSILQRSPDEGVGMEDLDKLQMELEMLLSNVVLRQRTLHSEIALITSAEENKPKKTASLSLAKSVCYIKRYKKHEDKSEPADIYNNDNNEDKSELSNGNRDSRDEDGDDSLDDLKEFSARHPPKRSIPLMPPSMVPVSRNDVTNKFWSMVEPYCSDIKLEDIKFLEDLLKSYELYEKDEFKEIPPLGTHYSLKWAKKDSKEEATPISRSENDIDESNDTKELESITIPKVCVPGPMVQRLVSALVEENPSPSGSVKRSRLDYETDENAGQTALKKPKDFLSGFILSNGEYSELEQNYRMLPFFHNSQCFEKKVRKELEAIGFLDPVNENNQDDSDEVLNELKRCQDELQSVASKNKAFLTNLLHTAKTEYRRQQIKTQIKNLNNEIADINMRNVALKLKKKHLCKKEADEAWKLLKEREALIKRLEEIS